MTCNGFTIKILTNQPLSQCRIKKSDFEEAQRRRGELSLSHTLPLELVDYMVRSTQKGEIQIISNLTNGARRLSGIFFHSDSCDSLALNHFF